MALTIKPVLSGSRIGRKSANVRYYVTGLDATTPDKMWDALFAGGLPQPDDPHPRTADLIVDEPAITEMVGEHSCFIDVGYIAKSSESGGGGGSGTDIELDGSLVAIREAIDYDGKPIKVIYNPNGRPGAAHEPDAAAGDLSGGRADVERLIGMKTLRFSRTEDSFPSADRFRMIGKTNSNAGWVFADDVGLWLCARVSARQAAGSNKPTVNYEFQGPEDGWERVVAYIEPTTGDPPTLNMGEITMQPNEPRLRGSFTGSQDRTLNGITIVRVQGSADFNTFGLPSVY